MPDDLVTLMAAHGIQLTRLSPDADVWTGACPFADHPELVDMHGKGRELAFRPDSPMHPAWRFVRPSMKPAFNVRNDRGQFHCFGCGAYGDRDDFLTMIGETQ